MTQSLNNSTSRILKITERIKSLTKAADELRKQQEILSFSARIDKIIKSHIRPVSYYEFEYITQYEPKLWDHEAIQKLLNAIEVKKIDKKLEDISHKIARLNKLVSILRTKFSQLKKINKRSLFRAQVHLIFKNLDDYHLNFDLLLINITGVHQKFKLNHHGNYHKNKTAFI